MVVWVEQVEVMVQELLVVLPDMEIHSQREQAVLVGKRVGEMAQGMVMVKRVVELKAKAALAVEGSHQMAEEMVVGIAEEMVVGMPEEMQLEMPKKMLVVRMAVRNQTVVVLHQMEQMVVVHNDQLCYVLF